MRKQSLIITLLSYLPLSPLPKPPPYVMTHVKSRAKVASPMEPKPCNGHTSIPLPCNCCRASRMCWILSPCKYAASQQPGARRCWKCMPLQSRRAHYIRSDRYCSDTGVCTDGGSRRCQPPVIESLRVQRGNIPYQPCYCTARPSHLVYLVEPLRPTMLDLRSALSMEERYFSTTVLTLSILNVERD